MTYLYSNVGVNGFLILVIGVMFIAAGIHNINKKDIFSKLLGFAFLTIPLRFLFDIFMLNR